MMPMLSPNRSLHRRGLAPATLLCALVASPTVTNSQTTDRDANEPSVAEQTTRFVEQTREQSAELWRKSLNEANKLWARGRDTANDLWQQSSDLWQPGKDALSPPDRGTLQTLWPQVVPMLSETLTLEDAQRDLPEQAWFGRDQGDAQAEINALLDQAVAALSLSPLEDERARIEAIRQDIDQAQETIARYRQERVGAPTQSMVKRTQADYDDLIAAERQRIADKKREKQQIQRDFADQLRAIGLELSDEQVEFLLSTVVGDTMIDLGIVFDNVKIITVELERLVRDSGEDLNSARRYYGLYVVLLRALKQMHLDVEQTIETDYIPRIDGIQQSAESLSADTEKLLRTQAHDRPGHVEVLRANLEAQQMTIAAARRYRDYLADQARQVRAARLTLEQDIRTAWNTYETVRVSGELVALVQSSQRLLDGLLERQVPPPRPFENLAMKREFEKLTDQLRATER